MTPAPNIPVEDTPYKYDVQDLAVATVTVYKDRAEVKRTIPVFIQSAGEIEVKVDGLSRLCDLDSVRVEGKGNATITEVSSLEKTVTKQVNQDSMKSIKEEVADLEKRIRVIETERERTTRRKQLYVGLADQIRNPSSDACKQSMVECLLTETGMSGVLNFMNVYSEQLKSCDDESYRLEAEIQDLRNQIRALRDQEMEAGRNSRETTEIRQTSILMDVKEKGEVILTVTYLVKGATWYPKYDIRAFSNEKTVKINYFGVINQKTGEDWTNARLILSTAQPGVGGTIPELRGQIVKFKPERRPDGFSHNGIGSRSSGYQYDSAPRASKMSSDYFSPEMASMSVMTAEVSEGALSTMYEIPRQATIPSDKQDHKVSVALLDLPCEFEHFTVPKMIPNAYLKAKLTNKSKFLFLQGPSNIFVDNNFMTKSSLQTVNPDEQFDVSLGIDFALKIEYRPLRQLHETSGMFTKTSTTQYRQVTEVKNTHVYPVKIQLEEQLPRSETDKIKVIVSSPSLPKEKEKEKEKEKPSGPVYLNSKGNVVWKATIKAGASQTFTLQYSIETLAAENRTIMFSEV